MDLSTDRGMVSGEEKTAELAFSKLETSSRNVTCASGVTDVIGGIDELITAWHLSFASLTSLVFALGDLGGSILALGNVSL